MGFVGALLFLFVCVLHICAIHEFIYLFNCLNTYFIFSVPLVDENNICNLLAYVALECVLLTLC